MTKKTKVMHVVECFGGGVMQCIAKICHMVDGNCESIVTHSRRKETPDKFERFFPENTIFEPWQATRSINPIADFKSVLHLRKIVKKHKPDVLHLQSSKAGAIGRLAFPFGGGMKILYTPAAYGFLQLNLSRKKRFIYRFLEKILGFTNHTTVACGMGEYKLAKQVATKADVICNSIAIDSLDEIAGERSLNDDFTIISSGRISYQKNFPLFVDIAKKFEQDNIKFIWIGGEVPEDVKIPSNMVVTGWIERDESVKIMSKAHIYLQTSLWEGLSITVLEAMGLGLPIVISDAVGNKEMIDNGKDGFICSELETYLQAIKKLIADEDLRKEFSQNARKKIQEQYSDENCKEQWINMYSKLNQ